MVAETRKFSPEVVDKAHRLLAEKRLRVDDDFANVWWVVSSSGANLYRVQSDWNPETKKLRWVTCTCPHGLHAGAGETRCYHAAAVLLLLREQEDAR
jgi:hypothetical protein